MVIIRRKAKWSVYQIPPGICNFLQLPPSACPHNVQGQAILGSSFSECLGHGILDGQLQI